MKAKLTNTFALLTFCTSLTVAAQPQQPSTTVNEERTSEQTIQSLYTTALSEQYAYELLRTLCKDIGPRPAGSENAENAVQWARMVMDSLGADQVILQEVDVPHWVRGDVEKASILESGTPLAVCALGGSVGTQKFDNGAVEAEVIEVQNFEELKELGEEKLRGKIVFYNRPMDPALINTGFAYGGAVNQRWAGAIEASKFGAVAVIVRSMTLLPDNHPHTGSMSYEGAENKIPAAAVSIVGANALHKAIQNNPNTKVSLTLSCKSLERTKSYNVIGEWHGTEKPEEILLVGGHLDSWELGEGAQDDGSGSMQSLAIPYYLAKNDIKLKRTLRVVLYMNEEFGLDGAKTYAERSKQLNENHVAAIESDGGSGAPRGFSIDGNDATVEAFRGLRTLFTPYGIHEFPAGYSGADIGTLDKTQTLLIGYRADNQRYFDYHHAATDVFESIHPRELELGAASMAALIYVLDLNDMYVAKENSDSK
ncbi:MAG: M28 family peptidase [Schleiferiaceae bacterium]